MKIGGREVNIQEVGVIALPLDELQKTLDREFSLKPCKYCGLILAVDSDSVKLVHNGASLTCLHCVLKLYPDVHAGRDPDTGNPITMREFLNHPNLVAGYRCEDIEET